MARRRYKNPFFRLGILLIILAAAWAGWLYTRPFSISSTAVAIEPVTTSSTKLPWPAGGEAALSIPKYNVFEVSGPQKTMPTASVAKIITALAVLQKQPLADGASGPTITLAQKDVDYYTSALAKDGSVVKVAAGEKISELDALEAMLLPSANNMANTLADWAFGSQGAYLSYVNSYVKTLGATGTHITDPSGFDPTTVSTAGDLTKIAQSVINNPVLSGVVAKYQANVPVAGTVYNTNWLLNSNGVVGIKTGNTDQAGGCFMFAAKRQIAGQTTTIVGSVLGESSLNAAMQDSLKLIKASASNFSQITAIRAGTTVATYTTPWGNSVPAVAAKNVELTLWKGQKVDIKSSVSKINAPANQNQQVGEVAVSVQSQTVKVPVVLKSDIQKPPLSWRLLRL